MATLSTGSAAPIRGTLFQIPTLLGFALQSFAPPGESKRRFPSLLSVPALPWKTSWAFHRCSNGFVLSEKPCPFLLPHGLGEVGTSCSLGLMDLSGLLPNTACAEISLLCTAPLALMSSASHKVEEPEPQGIRPVSDWHFPRKGANPSDLSHRLHPLPLGKIGMSRTIFSSQDPKILASPQVSLFATYRLPPIGR